MLRDNTDEWQDVPFKRRGNRQSDQASKKKDRITKVFVSNLPGKCSSKDLLELLKRYGEIDNTYIARKLDRLGKRFGFVTFRNVSDPKRLEGDLKDVWIGSYKLFIILARFVDGKKVEYEQSDDTRQEEGKKPTEEMKTKQPVGDAGRSNRSYCDIAGNKSHGSDVVTLRIDGNARSFIYWYDKALVGRVIDFKTLKTLRILLNDCGYNRVKIKYLGGLWVLLLFEDEENLNYFRDIDDKWKVWFGSLDRWNGQEIPFQRVTWLKVHGIPLHLVMDSVINAVASCFGKVIQDAQINDDVTDISYTYVAVVCSTPGRVNAKVNLLWNDSVYKVWVEEDIGKWLPDCIADINAEPVQSMGEDHASEIDRNFNDNLDGEGSKPNDGTAGRNDNTVNQQEDHVTVEINTHIDLSVDHSPPKGNRRNRRKGARRKGGRQSVHSSADQERPKKRPRSETDPFDIDRFIWRETDGISSVDDRQEVEGSPNNFLTPDLNKHCVHGEPENTDAAVSSEEHTVSSETNVDRVTDNCSENIEKEATETVELGTALGAQNLGNIKAQVCKLVEPVVEDLVHEAGIQIDRSPLDVEAEETIALARALGVENLQDFMPELHEILRSEGYQDVG